MPEIIHYIKVFYSKEFRWGYFLFIACILGVIIYLNYWHGLERLYVARGDTKAFRFCNYYLLYFIPFAIAFLIQLLFFKELTYYKNGWFWVILFLAPAFFSFRVNFDLHRPWVAARWEGIDRTLYLYCINWIVRVFVVLIPVFILWWLKDRNNQPFYGTKPLYNIQPYLLMLLIMVPLIALAATQSDFLQMYPKAKILSPIPLNNFTNVCKYLLFEISYGFDFVSIEFFFRGFLILSLIRICGTHCIIPVACFYCTIHLGKPMGEAISSFFGGMILGIVAYNTRSIWGGLIVHLGIAWMMELAGWSSHLLKG